MTKRLLDKDRLVIATHNKGKLREFNELLTFHVRDIVAAGDLGLPEPEETGTTFAENALLKARAAMLATHSTALADDSGLCVNALNGQPGLYSARWAGPNKDFMAAMTKIHQMLGANTDRSAYFICVLAVVWPDGHAETIEGRVEGHLVWPPRGENGHGYDPMFVPQGHDRTFGEMDAEEKHAISHRGVASRRLLFRFCNPI